MGVLAEILAKWAVLRLGNGAFALIFAGNDLIFADCVLIIGEYDLKDGEHKLIIAAHDFTIAGYDGILSESEGVLGGDDLIPGDYEDGFAAADHGHDLSDGRSGVSESKDLCFAAGFPGA